MSKPYWSGPSAGEESRSPGESPVGGIREPSYTGGYQSRYQPRSGEGYSSGHSSGYGTGTGSEYGAGTGSEYGSRYTSRYQSGTGHLTHDSSYQGGYGEYGRSGTGLYEGTGTYEPPQIDDYENYPDQDYPDDRDRPDTRWRWVAGLAAMVLLVALIAIGVATRGGESSSSSTAASTTPAGEPAAQDAITTSAPRTVIATAPPAPPAPVPPPAESTLTPETVVTVTPTHSAAEPAPSAVPPPAPPEATPPGQTITYTVTGSRQLFDLVSIIYTDEQGFPRTDVNVALPWTRTVVLNPGVVTKSVTATSLTGQLNCTVTDGTGATISAQNNNAAITTCTS